MFPAMDNLAHTLVGAALGRAVAGHRVPRAALLGAVASNAPDWSELLFAPAVPQQRGVDRRRPTGPVRAVPGGGDQLG